MERDIKPLLILMRDNLERIFYRQSNFPSKGLCSVNMRLSDYGLITNAEYYKLKDYLMTHKPFWAKVRLFFTSPFWWRPGAIRPRMRWLNKQINKL